jgi:serine/threonine protein kinase
MNTGFDIPGYVDVEQIGVGGFGRVFRARQPAFDRTVAVKLLNGRMDDAATLRRFQRECQALGAVSGHPNIVPVYDAGGTPDGQPYLVMDYVRGGSLADRLARSGPLPWPDVAAIGVKLSGALHSAHGAGVLHRDIKPENILVSGYGEPQLADFGIAQRAGFENRTTTAAAMTPSHTAPEQFGGAPPSVATDVYALASTLFTLLTARSPFQGGPDESIFALIARSATEPVPDVRPLGVPDPLARVIEQGLAKDPAARPESALAFGHLLQEAQQALSVAVTPLPIEADGGPPPQPLNTPQPGAEGYLPANTPDTAATRQRPPGAYPPPQPQQSPPPYPPAQPYQAPPEYRPAPQAPPARRGRAGWLIAAALVVLIVAGGVGYLLATRNAGTTGAGATGSGSTGAGTTSGPGSTTPGSSTPTTAQAYSQAPSTTTGSDTAGSYGGSTAAAGTLNAQLLQAGQPPLVGWSTNADLAQIMTPDTAFFCKRTVDLSGGQTASVLFTGPNSQVLDEHVYRVGVAKATKAMSDLRASTSCKTWTGDLGAGPETVTAGAAVSVADDSAAYQVTTSVAQTYQVFFRRGGDFGVITVSAVIGSITTADQTQAAQAAKAAAARLAG